MGICSHGDTFVLCLFFLRVKIALASIKGGFCRWFSTQREIGSSAVQDNVPQGRAEMDFAFVSDVAQFPGNLFKKKLIRYRVVSIISASTCRDTLGSTS
jgi:hypothetical protein